MSCDLIHMAKYSYNHYINCLTWLPFSFFLFFYAYNVCVCVCVYNFIYFCMYCAFVAVQGFL